MRPPENPRRSLARVAWLDPPWVVAQEQSRKPRRAARSCNHRRSTRPQPECLRDMIEGHDVFSFQVGHRLCHALDLDETARAQSALSQFLTERLAGFVRQHGFLLPSGRRSQSRLRDPGRNLRRRLTGHVGQQFIGSGSADGYDQIEPVQERSRDAAAVTSPNDNRTLASAVEHSLATRTWVHGGDEEKVRRKGDGATGSVDSDQPFLERLPQRFKRSDRELT